MKLLAGLTELFIHAFQITRPRPEQQKRAEWILGGLMLVAILLVIGLIVAMLTWAFYA